MTPARLVRLDQLDHPVPSALCRLLAMAATAATAVLVAMAATEATAVLVEPVVPVVPVVPAASAPLLRLRANRCCSPIRSPRHCPLKAKDPTAPLVRSAPASPDNAHDATLCHTHSSGCARTRNTAEAGMGDIIGNGCMGIRLVLGVLFLIFAVLAVIVLAPLLLLVFLMIPFMFL